MFPQSTVEVPSQALLTTAETASLLKLSKRTVLNYAREGRLQPVRLTSRTVRFSAESVRALVADAETVRSAVGEEDAA